MTDIRPERKPVVRSKQAPAPASTKDALANPPGDATRALLGDNLFGENLNDVMPSAASEASPADARAGADEAKDYGDAPDGNREEAADGSGATGTDTSDFVSCEIRFALGQGQPSCTCHALILADVPKKIARLVTGEPPMVRLEASEVDAASKEVFESLHASLISSSQCACSALADGTEIVFVPVHSRLPQGGDNQLKPVLWGYRFLQGCVAAGQRWIEDCRIPVVFDLDDTLVVAAGENSLVERLEKLRRNCRGFQATLEDPDINDEMRGQLEGKLSRLEKEGAHVAEDLRMLREYIDSDCLTDTEGTLRTAKLEAAHDITGSHRINRPIVRIAGEHGAVTVFTRIDPDASSTSMIIRVRAGWSKLRALLLLGVDGTASARALQQRRYDTYICTAAEQPYALEVCRLLDPDCTLIPRKHLVNHLVCVSRENKKTMAAALHHPIAAHHRHQAAARNPNDDAWNMEDEQEEAFAEDDYQGVQEVPTMGIAIIVDDRVDVWEDNVKGQIVKATPFNWYQNLTAFSMGDSRNGRSPDAVNLEEVQRIMNYLKGLRADIFAFIHQNVDPMAQDLMDEGVEDAMRVLDMFELFTAAPFVEVTGLRKALPPRVRSRQPSDIKIESPPAECALAV